MSLELVELSPLPGRRVTIETELSIGRQECDLTISSPQVSRRHARVTPAGADVEVTDLGSRNGTFVNGERIAETRALTAGDELRVGETTWEVTPVDAAAATELEKARGDVPAPPPPAPHPVAAAVQPPLPAPVPSAGATPALEENQRPSTSAARRVEATLICYAVVMLTAIGVVGYLATR